MQRVHFGPAQGEGHLGDLDRREFGMMLVILAGVLWFGLYPQPLLDTTASLMTQLAQGLPAETLATEGLLAGEAP